MISQSAESWRFESSAGPLSFLSDAMGKPRRKKFKAKYSTEEYVEVGVVKKSYLIYDDLHDKFLTIHSSGGLTWIDPWELCNRWTFDASLFTLPKAKTLIKHYKQVNWREYKGPMINGNFPRMALRLVKRDTEQAIRLTGQSRYGRRKWYQVYDVVEARRAKGGIVGTPNK